MNAALTGWLGIVIVVLAGVLAVAVDIVRQPSSPARRASGRTPRGRWLLGLTVAAAVFAVSAAAATLIRFAALT